MNISKTTATLGIILSSIAIAGAGWGAADYLGVRPALVSELNDTRATVAANSELISLTRYEALVALSKQRELTALERALLCKYAKQANVPHPGC
jgi:hypothetical protein